MRQSSKQGGHYCTALGCTSRSSTTPPSVSFHSFPTDGVKKQLWIAALRRRDANFQQPSRHSKLCSKHFTAECFVQPVEGFQPTKRRRLHPEVVPSIFLGSPSPRRPSSSHAKQRRTTMAVQEVEYANFIQDLRRASPVWDGSNFDQMARTMQERMDDFFRTPQPMMSGMQQQQQSSSSGIRGRFENQQDGTILYKVSFDVEGYQPQDLKTSLVAERTVRVCGSSNRQDPQTGAQQSASFDEQFALPDNVDPARLRSTVTNGQLTITAPVLPPQYASIGGGAAGTGTGRSQPPQVQPHRQQQQQQHFQSQSYTTSSSGSPRLTPRSGSPSAFGQLANQQQQHQQQGSVRTISAYQLEVDVGREFEPQDLTVATTAGGRRLTVHGRREVKASGKSSMREFRDDFDLPAGVDPALVTARLRSDGRVVVDMPLLREAAGFTYWPVSVEHRG